MKIYLSAFVCFIFSCMLSRVEISIATDTLTISGPLTINETLISRGGKFHLGFFSPGISNNYYLGIWYAIAPAKVVWVANRENPLNDASGGLSIGDDGNLVILDKSGQSVWKSSNMTYINGGSVAQILDSGNVELRDETGTLVWQSFDHPSHAMIPGMKLGWNSKTGLHLNLTSWKSSDDPSPGEYTYGIDTKVQAELVIWKGSSTFYRSGPWNKISFGEVYVPNSLLFNMSVKLDAEDAYYEYNMLGTTTFLIATISDDGVFQLLLKNDVADWVMAFVMPQVSCSNYMRCGPNSVCIEEDSPYCSCMTGYIPKNPKEWHDQVWSGGCIGQSQLSCSTLDNYEEHSDLKLPAFSLFFVNTSMSLEECRAECINNCTCKAYASSYLLWDEGGCFLWFEDLVDVMKLEFSINHLFIRVPILDSISASAPGYSKNRWRIPVIVVMNIASTFLLLVVIFLIWTRKYQRKGGAYSSKKGDEKNLELSSYDIVTIERATQSFSDMNKIGEGGFGPVYKGKLSCGEEIAVKRLSETSCQGVNEFKNEVMLITKLQHRNLVRLLGCCIHDEEKMLIYEYMANGSLDSYIFDGSKHTKSGLLEWKRRFAIIGGIARGLLYIHHDSRLRIIHRDLKASNVLLDTEMNPKISDFGMARAFREEQLAIKTKRVAGTFGYMSPEYAIDGVYSMKSDVFSFGVLVLEIVSGTRNSQFHHPDHDFNLLGHAWKLLMEGRALQLIDPLMEDSFSISEVLRCIQIGLLCVQQRPEDRPTMSSVLLMLDNDSAVLQQPNCPGFFTERSFNQNEATCTMLEGR
ncbi:transmembrane signal receptor [Lithospermum erythrorhizon]|uniref:Receptor-like serine/threonine-protein kinase n=1 Tax=Lithospermum erythrorhizon TaxID=34254 RepID=A0AAV3QAA4_LITER